MLSGSILSIKNATVFRKNTCVFDNFSLELQLGESVAIIGPNGAGKTTLLKLITRELYPVVKPGSHLKLFGEERVNIWELRKHIGIVSHEFQVGYQAIATGLDVVLSAWFGSVGVHGHHNVTPEQTDRAKQMMAELDITSLAENQYLQLSTGQQRRLLLARALVHEPEVLVFDEPTNGLDLKSGFQLLNEMRQHCQNGTTLILVTHHIQEIIPEIERVVCLKNGKVVEDGGKTSVLVNDRVSRVYDIPVNISQANGFYSVSPASP